MDILYIKLLQFTSSKFYSLKRDKNISKLSSRFGWYSTLENSCIHHHFRNFYLFDIIPTHMGIISSSGVMDESID